MQDVSRGGRWLVTHDDQQDRIFVPPSRRRGGP